MKNYKPKLLILISIILTALIVGGGVFAYQQNKFNKDKNNLESLINSLQSQLDKDSKQTAKLKTLSWNPTEGDYPVNIYEDQNLSVKYPASCSAIVYKPDDITQKTSMPTPAEVDCPADKGKIKLLFTQPYTMKDPENPQKIVNASTHNSYNKDRYKAVNSGTVANSFGLYTWDMIKDMNYPDSDWRVDYYFGYLGGPSAMQAVGYVPAGSTPSQFSVFNSILKSFKCSGTACPRITLFDTIQF